MTFLRHRCAAAGVILPLLHLLTGCATSSTMTNDATVDGTDDRVGSVIFVHPDGASAATWTAARALHVGPDGQLAWDRLPAIAVYRGHMRDSLTATSNGGATTHAFGVKVASDAFGRTAGGSRGKDIVDEHGRSRSVALQAIDAGIPVGLVQTGIAPEPGTASFVAPVDSRRQFEEIAAQLVESGTEVLFSGGEKYFLPKGEPGMHGEGVRLDGRNLMEEARQRGYTIVRTRAELQALPIRTTRVLGLFADGATFNAQPEEDLAAAGLPLYDPEAPTVAEMTAVALRILQAQHDQFLLIVEEEATDNFGNTNNAAGTFEAARRADEAIARCPRLRLRHPDTLLITTADSDGGGLRMIGIPVMPDTDVPTSLPNRTNNGAPIDGVGGTGSAPFYAMPDQFGQRLPFYVVWASGYDVSGGVLVRAAGLHSDEVRGSMDNTEVAELMRRTLFGRPEDRR